MSKDCSDLGIRRCTKYLSFKLKTQEQRPTWTLEIPCWTLDI